MSPKMGNPMGAQPRLGQQVATTKRQLQPKKPHSQQSQKPQPLLASFPESEARPQSQQSHRPQQQVVERPLAQLSQQIPQMGQPWTSPEDLAERAKALKFAWRETTMQSFWSASLAGTGQPCPTKQKFIERPRSQQSSRTSCSVESTRFRKVDDIKQTMHLWMAAADRKVEPLLKYALPVVKKNPLQLSDSVSTALESNVEVGAGDYLNRILSEKTSLPPDALTWALKAEAAAELDYIEASLAAASFQKDHVLSSSRAAELSRATKQIQMQPGDTKELESFTKLRELAQLVLKPPQVRLEGKKDKRHKYGSDGFLDESTAALDKEDLRETTQVIHRLLGTLHVSAVKHELAALLAESSSDARTFEHLDKLDEKSYDTATILNQSKVAFEVRMSEHLRKNAQVLANFLGKLQEAAATAVTRGDDAGDTERAKHRKGLLREVESMRKTCLASIRRFQDAEEFKEASDGSSETSSVASGYIGENNFVQKKLLRRLETIVLREVEATRSAHDHLLSLEEERIAAMKSLLRYQGAFGRQEGGPPTNLHEWIFRRTQLWSELNKVLCHLDVHETSGAEAFAQTIDSQRPSAPARRRKKSLKARTSTVEAASSERIRLRMELITRKYALLEELTEKAKAQWGGEIYKWHGQSKTWYSTTNPHIEVLNFLDAKVVELLQMGSMVGLGNTHALRELEKELASLRVHFEAEQAARWKAWETSDAFDERELEELTTRKLEDLVPRAAEAIDTVMQSLSNQTRGRNEASPERRSLRKESTSSLKDAAMGSTSAVVAIDEDITMRIRKLQDKLFELQKLKLERDAAGGKLAATHRVTKEEHTTLKTKLDLIENTIATRKHVAELRDHLMDLRFRANCQANIDNRQGSGATSGESPSSKEGLGGIDGCAFSRAAQLVKKLKGDKRHGITVVDLLVKEMKRTRRQIDIIGSRVVRLRHDIGKLCENMTALVPGVDIGEMFESRQALFEKWTGDIRAWRISTRVQNKMLNFWKKRFDMWYEDLAEQHGLMAAALFRDALRAKGDWAKPIVYELVKAIREPTFEGSTEEKRHQWRKATQRSTATLSSSDIGNSLHDRTIGKGLVTELRANSQEFGASPVSSSEDSELPKLPTITSALKKAVSEHMQQAQTKEMRLQSEIGQTAETSSQGVYSSGLTQHSNSELSAQNSLKQYVVRELLPKELPARTEWPLRKPQRLPTTTGSIGDRPVQKDIPPGWSVGWAGRRASAAGSRPSSPVNMESEYSSEGGDTPQANRVPVLAPFSLLEVAERLETYTVPSKQVFASDVARSDAALDFSSGGDPRQPKQHGESLHSGDSETQRPSKTSFALSDTDACSPIVTALPRRSAMKVRFLEKAQLPGTKASFACDLEEGHERRPAASFGALDTRVTLEIAPRILDHFDSKQPFRLPGHHTAFKSLFSSQQKYTALQGDRISEGLANTFRGFAEKTDHRGHTGSRNSEKKAATLSIWQMGALEFEPCSYQPKGMISSLERRRQQFNRRGGFIAWRKSEGSGRRKSKRRLGSSGSSATASRTASKGDSTRGDTSRQTSKGSSIYAEALDSDKSNWNFLSKSERAELFAPTHAEREEVNLFDSIEQLRRQRLALSRRRETLRSGDGRKRSVASSASLLIDILSAVDSMDRHADASDYSSELGESKQGSKEPPLCARRKSVASNSVEERRLSRRGSRRGSSNRGERLPQVWKDCRRESFAPKVVGSRRGSETLLQGSLCLGRVLVGAPVARSQSDSDATSDLSSASEESQVVVESSDRERIQYHGLQSLRRCRELLLQRFGSITNAFSSVIGARRERFLMHDDLSNLLQQLGVTDGDTLHRSLFYLYKLAALEVSNATQKNWESRLRLDARSFLRVFAACEPATKLTHLRERLCRKYGTLGVAFRAVVGGEMLALSLAMFQDLTCGVGASAREAKKLFLRLVRHNEQVGLECLEGPILTKYAFHAALTCPAALEAARRFCKKLHMPKRSQHQALKKPIAVEGKNVFEYRIDESKRYEAELQDMLLAFQKVASRIDQRYFCRPLTKDGLRKALRPFGLDVEDSSCLFRLTQHEMHDGAMCVHLRDVVIVAIAGLGAWGRKLSKAVGPVCRSMKHRIECLLESPLPGRVRFGLRWGLQGFLGLPSARPRAQRGLSGQKFSRTRGQGVLPRRVRLVASERAMRAEERHLARLDLLKQKRFTLEELIAKGGKNRKQKGMKKQSTNILLQGEQSGAAEFDGSADIEDSSSRDSQDAYDSQDAHVEPPPSPSPEANPTLRLGSRWVLDQICKDGVITSFDASLILDPLKLAERGNPSPRFSLARPSNAFHKIELQFATMRLKEFVASILVRSKTPKAAFEKFVGSTGAKTIAFPNHFEILLAKAMPSYHVLDVKRVLMMVDRVGVGEEVTFALFLKIIRFASPVQSILQFHKRLVQIHGTLAAALLELGLVSQEIGKEHFEEAVLVDGIGSGEAEQIFRVIAAAQPSGILYALGPGAIELAARFAHALSALQAFSARLQDLKFESCMAALTHFDLSNKCVSSGEEFASTLRPLAFPPNAANITFEFFRERERINAKDSVEDFPLLEMAKFLAAAFEGTTSFADDETRASGRPRCSLAVSSLCSVDDEEKQMSLAALQELGSYVRANFATPSEAFAAFNARWPEKGVSRSEWAAAANSFGFGANESSLRRWTLIFNRIVDFAEPSAVSYVTFEAFLNALDRSSPCLSLTVLRTRLVTRWGSLEKAFEAITGRKRATEVNLELWRQQLERAWISAADASVLMPQLRAASGCIWPQGLQRGSLYTERLTSHAFMRGLEHHDIASRLIELTLRLEACCGPVSRAFEGVEYGDRILDATRFGAQLQAYFSINLDDATLIHRHLERCFGGAQIDGLIDVLSAIQSLFYLYPEYEPPVLTTEALVPFVTATNTSSHKGCSSLFETPSPISSADIRGVISTAVPDSSDADGHSSDSDCRPAEQLRPWTSTPLSGKQSLPFSSIRNDSGSSRVGGRDGRATVQGIRQVSFLKGGKSKTLRGRNRAPSDEPLRPRSQCGSFDSIDPLTPSKLLILPVLKRTGPAVQISLPIVATKLSVDDTTSLASMSALQTKKALGALSPEVAPSPQGIGITAPTPSPLVNRVPPGWSSPSPIMPTTVAFPALELARGTSPNPRNIVVNTSSDSNVNPVNNKSSAASSRATRRSTAGKPFLSLTGLPSALPSSSTHSANAVGSLASAAPSTKWETARAPTSLATSPADAGLPKATTESADAVPRLRPEGGGGRGKMTALQSRSIVFEDVITAMRRSAS